MTKKDVYQIFTEEFYGDKYNLARALDTDYLSVNFAWSCFIDSLCKDGKITLKQYENWGYPWRKRK